jgi:hypothetical protein
MMIGTRLAPAGAAFHTVTVSFLDADTQVQERLIDVMAQAIASVAVPCRAGQRSM